MVQPETLDATGMKAVVYEEQGDIGGMRCVDLPVPDIDDHECLVGTEAIALNGFDPMMALGTTRLRTPLPMVPCGDAAGVVERMGPEANALRARHGLADLHVGDRVSLYPFVAGKGMMGEVVRGTCREFFPVSSVNLLRLPDGLSFIDAAALPIAYGTAYRLVHTRAAVQKGDTVLILGAGGGVGTCCIQLAKRIGARVIACAGSAEKTSRLTELGADHVIDSSQEDFVEATRGIAGRPRFLGSEGVDVVVNYVGGDTWARALRTVRTGGRVVTCGASAGHAPATDLRYIWSFELNILGSNGWLPGEQRELMRLAAEREVVPCIHSVRPMEEAAEAIQELADRKVVGKSILLPPRSRATGCSPSGAS